MSNLQAMAVTWGVDGYENGGWVDGWMVLCCLRREDKLS